MPGEHRDIVEAVLNGNAEAAKEAMTCHLEKFCQNLIKMEKGYRQKARVAA
jgi:DNA-binding GntR family transcriptional regulator